MTTLIILTAVAALVTLTAAVTALVTLTVAGTIKSLTAIASTTAPGQFAYICNTRDSRRKDSMEVARETLRDRC
jgi:hypothetical protein